MRKKKVLIEPSSGNVFWDLDYPHPQESLAKAKIASYLCRIIDRKGLTQMETAKLLMIDQPRVSDLICGRLRRFSTERLFDFLTALDQDIEIVIKPKGRSKRHGGISVRSAA